MHNDVLQSKSLPIDVNEISESNVCHLYLIIIQITKELSGQRLENSTVMVLQ